MAGAGEESVQMYARAASGYFRNEEYGDSGRIIEILKAGGVLSSDMQALQGKLLFQDGDLDAAFTIFEALSAEGYRNASVFFLMGLVLSSRGERTRAGEYLRQAVHLEPDYYLYWFRLAENIWMLGEDCTEELQKALDLAPENGWVLNLAGQVSMDACEAGRAVEYLERAVANVPEETDIRINLAVALLTHGEEEKAFRVLEEIGENPAALNCLGNFYVRRNEFEKAVEYYTAAIQHAPECAEYRENCAAGFIELNMPLKAEEILSSLIEKHPDGRSLNLMGNCLGMTGEYKRAEAAYREALTYEPAWDEPKLNLADLYISMGAVEEAETILKRIDFETNPRANRLAARLHRLTKETLRCSSCGRTWTVPRHLDDQGALKIVGQPPGNLPAGKCPSCGMIYCIECVSSYLDDNRFVCPECGDYLKLNDDRLKYIFNDYFAKHDV